MRPQTKASSVSIIFLIAGALFALIRITDLGQSLPMLIVYAVLLVNTFFSVRIFSAITPPSSIQKTCDAGLFFIYLLTAWEFGSPKGFAFAFLLLFIVACVKYSFLLYETSHPKLIKRKILVDLSGALAGALTLCGIMAGYQYASLWSLAIVFSFANVFLFFVQPLYQLDAESQRHA